MIRRPPRSTLFPSPPLFRSWRSAQPPTPPRKAGNSVSRHVAKDAGEFILRTTWLGAPSSACCLFCFAESSPPADRKSTRLNSSHLVISYAVFCLKKKKNHIQVAPDQLIKDHKRVHRSHVRLDDERNQHRIGEKHLDHMLLSTAIAPTEHNNRTES